MHAGGFGVDLAAYLQVIPEQLIELIFINMLVCIHEIALHMDGDVE